MATSTGNRDTEKGLRDGVDLLISEIHGELARISAIERFRADGEKAGGDEVFRAFSIALVRHQVTGDLLADELIKGFVLVNRVDDVIAIPPGLREGHIDIAARGLGIAGDIEPVTCPTFGELAAVEQLIEQAIGGHLLGRRQAGEIEIQTAHERGVVRTPDGFEAFGFEFGEDEVIDVGLCPAGCLGKGHLGLSDGLVGPPILCGHAIILFGGDFAFAWIGRAAAHPGLEVGDDGVWQFAAFVLRWHAGIWIMPADGGDEKALFQITRHHGRSGIAAGSDADT